MSSFRLTVTTDNAAFEDSRNMELARILRDVADRLDNDISQGSVYDYNGNTVGSFGAVADNPLS